MQFGKAIHGTLRETGSRLDRTKQEVGEDMVGVGVGLVVGLVIGLIIGLEFGEGAFTDEGWCLSLGDLLRGRI